MMQIYQKLTILEKILEEIPTNYAESFKTDIQFQLEGYTSEQLDTLFLSNCSNENVIRNWIDKLTSRIVMHEDDEEVNEIIQVYILNG